MSLHHLPTGNLSNLLISNHLLLQNYPGILISTSFSPCLIPPLSYSLPLSRCSILLSFLPPSFSPLLPPSTCSLGIYSVTDSVFGVGGRMKLAIQGTGERDIVAILKCL